jgi:ATPase subunit of ABC transporter with duplicated ATPase domains
MAGKELAQSQIEKEADRTEKKIAEMQQFITRFRAKATKARQAQSRQKQVDRMEMPEIKRSSRREPVFTFTPQRASGREVLNVKGVSKSYQVQGVPLPVLEDVSVELARGDKLAVVGPNGIGKSTLLKMIVGELQADSGEVLPGYEVHMGYFAQDLHEVTRSKGTVYDWLYSASPDKEIGTVRSALGRVLFSGDDVKKPLAALSGGEATRLRLAELMLRADNLLVLDEPTNHLDLEGREALMKSLMAYTGSLIFVSHDRHFVSSVATRVLALTPEGMEDFAGTYDEYLARQGEDYLSVEGAGTLAAKNPPKPESGAAMDFEQRKHHKREIARLRKKVGQLERNITALEGEMAQIDSQYAEKDYYDKTSWEQIEKDEQAKKKLSRKLEATVADWESAAEDLETMQ